MYPKEFFDSKHPATSYVPASYVYSNPQSDHLPVIAKLRP